MRIAKPDTLADLGGLGLSLAESKQLLAGIQREIIAAQARVQAVHRPQCRRCSTTCRVKDYRQHAIATLFGQVAVRLPRYWDRTSELYGVLTQAVRAKVGTFARQILTNLTHVFSIGYGKQASRAEVPAFCDMFCTGH